MHNILIKEIQELADQLSRAISTEESALLLTKSRELHEKIVVFHHYSSQNKTINKDIEIEKGEVEVRKPEEIKQPTPKKVLSVQERIEKIMAAAPKIDDHQKPSFQPKTKKAEHQAILKPDNSEIKIDLIAEKSTQIFETKSTEKDVKVSPETTKKASSDSLKTTLEEEFKDAISADYAAELFENADKVVMTKKSLNDKLSQSQIQIGLNDRIAFVKHLFDGNQADFNNILTKLNSFNHFEEAVSFVKQSVKTTYNWMDKEEYEERFIELIERKYK